MDEEGFPAELTWQLIATQIDAMMNNLHNNLQKQPKKTNDLELLHCFTW